MVWLLGIIEGKGIIVWNFFSISCTFSALFSDTKKILWSLISRVRPVRGWVENVHVRLHKSCVNGSLFAYWTTACRWPQALPACLRSNIKPTITLQPPSFTLNSWLSASVWLTECVREENKIWNSLLSSLTNLFKSIKAILSIWMELPVANEMIHLDAFRPRLLSVTNEKPTLGAFDESGYYHQNSDRNGVAARGSDGSSGYDTLDAPPHYDFYANTEVWGRRKRFRPSLYQLHANPQVRSLFCSVQWVKRNKQKQGKPSR